MTAPSYSFIDIAALPGVRERFARGEALMLLGEDLATVLWVNGPGAELFGSGDIDALTDGPSPFGTVARRQLMALPGFPDIGAARPVALRLTSGMSSRAPFLQAATVPLPQGGAGILLAGAGPGGDRQKVAGRAIAGIAQPGQFAAIVDRDGAFLAASPGMAELGLTQKLLQRLVAEAAHQPSHLVKSRVEAGNRVLPAGLVHLSEDASLLIVVDEGFVDFGEDLLAPDEAEDFEADAQEPLLVRPAEEGGPDEGLSGPGLDITLAEEPEESWYFNSQSPSAAAASAEARLAALQAGAPVRFNWRTDADGRFQSVSPEFTATLGLAEADIVGHRFAELAGRFGFDRNGEIAALLGGRDTWSGMTVLWPVGDGGIAVPVDLAALPAYGRSRLFEGFRGFGVARVADAVFRADETPEEPPEAEAPGSTPAAGDVAAEQAFDLAGAAGTEAAAAREPSLKEQSDEVVRLLSEPRSAPSLGLTPYERNAFDEIGKRLKETSPVAAASVALLSAREKGASAPGADAEALDDGTIDIPTGRTEEAPPPETAALSEPSADLAVPEAEPADIAKAAEAETAEPSVEDGTAPLDADAAFSTEQTSDADRSGEIPDVEAPASPEDPAADAAMAADRPEPADEAPAFGETVDQAVPADAAEEQEEELPQIREAGEGLAETTPHGDLREPSADEPPFALPAQSRDEEGPVAEATVEEGADESAAQATDEDPAQSLPAEALGNAVPAEPVPDRDESRPEEPHPAVSGDALTAFSASNAEDRFDPPADAEGVEASEAPGTDFTQLSENQVGPVAALEERAAGASEEHPAAAEPDADLADAAPPAAREEPESTGSDAGWLSQADEVPSDEPGIAPPETTSESLPDIAAEEPLLAGSRESVEATSQAVPEQSDAAAVHGPAAGDVTGERPNGWDTADEAAVPAADTALLDHLPVPVLVHAGDALHYANAEFFALSGYASLDAFREAGGLGALLDAPDRAGGDGRLRLRSRSGEEFPVESLLRSIPWRGGKALLLVLRRVGAALPPPEGGAEPPEADAGQRLAEMRAIVDTATDGVVLIAADGGVRAMSRPAEALFGLDAADAAGKPFVELFAPESRQAVADYLDGLADNGVASVLNDGREVVGREKGGGALPLFMTIGTLPGGNGFCAVLRDITQWKRAEEELTRSRALAERASSHKTEFLARVSHEIRTPLNAIIGFSELMLDEKFGPVGSERYRDYLRDINRSGNHVLSLVNDLLDISKIEAGQQEMAYEAVSLNEALSESVATMQPQANRERVIIRSSLSPGLPEVVADHRSLRQIALNILSNAIRFTPAGGQVIVSTAHEASGDVVLRVRDTGIGMTQAEIEQALKPFKQINSLQRTRSDGTGLGLPLTKAMVEANRARFMIASTPGEGTLVEVLFPSTRVLA